MSGPVPTLRGFRSAAAFLILAGPALAGCSMSFPMSSMMPDGTDVTGSLGEVPFGRFLDEEDRRREKAALSTALDPQGDGSTIRWENAKSGHKGSITPVGHAYPSDAKICRAFVSDLTHEAAKAASVQGTACTVAAGDWVVRDMKSAPRA